MSRVENISIENARLVFRNFSGKPDKFNPNGGNRNFGVVITDHEFAKQLIAEGWNVKQFNAREDEDEEEEPDYFLMTKLNYRNRPPHVYLCTTTGKTMLTEETVSQVDYAEISGVDIIISPFQYENISGRSGISAYVKTMYINVVEDEFAGKYNYDDDEPPFDMNE